MDEYRNGLILAIKDLEKMMSAAAKAGETKGGELPGWLVKLGKVVRGYLMPYGKLFYYAVKVIWGIISFMLKAPLKVARWERSRGSGRQPIASLLMFVVWCVPIAFIVLNFQPHIVWWEIQEIGAGVWYYAWRLPFFLFVPISLEQVALMTGLWVVVKVIVSVCEYFEKQFNIVE